MDTSLDHSDPIGSRLDWSPLGGNRPLPPICSHISAWSALHGLIAWGFEAIVGVFLFDICTILKTSAHKIPLHGRRVNLRQGTSSLGIGFIVH